WPWGGSACSGSASADLSPGPSVRQLAALPKPPCDVTLCERLARPLEKFSSAADFDEFSQVHEGGRLRDPRGLLHIVRHDHQRVVFLQIEDQVLDLRRRDRI